MPAVNLVEQLVGNGYDADLAVRGLRTMLNSGVIGLGPEMNICLLKQYA
jgi:hypothetical protein